MNSYSKFDSDETITKDEKQNDMTNIEYNKRSYIVQDSNNESSDIVLESSNNIILDNSDNNNNNISINSSIHELTAGIDENVLPEQAMKNSLDLSYSSSISNNNSKYDVIDLTMEDDDVSENIEDHSEDYICDTDEELLYRNYSSNNNNNNHHSNDININDSNSIPVNDLQFTKTMPLFIPKLKAKSTSHVLIQTPKSKLSSPQSKQSPLTIPTVPRSSMNLPSIKIYLSKSTNPTKPTATTTLLGQQRVNRIMNDDDDKGRCSLIMNSIICYFK